MTANASGIATAPTFTANGTSGAYTVTASVAGVTTPASFALTNNPGAPTGGTISGGNNQTAPVTMPFGTTLSVTVTDANGNPLAGVNVTFNAPTSGPSGTFTSATRRAELPLPLFRERVLAAGFLTSGTYQVAQATGATTFTATTNAQGVASVNFIANSSVGTYIVTASIAGGGTATFNLTNTRSANTITFNPIAAVLQGTSSVALVATATSGNTVIFTSLTPAVCTVSGATAYLVKGASAPARSRRMIPAIRSMLPQRRSPSRLRSISGRIPRRIPRSSA